MCPFPRERYPRSMAAKKKTESHTAHSDSREDADLQDLLGLHFQASRRMEELLEQIQELRSAGKLTEARTLQMHADGIEQDLRALEAELRISTRTPR
jgi:hypothetical protein